MPFRRLTLAVVVLAALAAVTAAGVARSAGGAEAKAAAYGVQVIVPDGDVAVAAGIAAPPEAAGSQPDFVYGGGVVATGALATTATAAADERADAIATATAESVSLFGGEITVEKVEVKASGGASERRADGSVALSSLIGLVVLGEAVEAAPLDRVPLADWGYAVVLEQAILREESDAFGFQGAVTGLRVHLTTDHGGLPGGTDILVGYAEAAVRAPKPVPLEVAAHIAPRLGPGSLVRPKKQRKAASGLSREPPAIVKNPPKGIKPKLTQGGYVFPVYGPEAGFSDDFGAPRADTIWHHGNDIFAPEGTPILAVADGELFFVGWNRLGGHRLWLRDAQGNEFYFAHLSAYSPVAFNGSRVRAGDVIGFVGHTGDADGTPPHLHFEIHPRELLGLGYDGVVDPREYLLAWKRLEDAAFDELVPPEPEPGNAPPAAAVLLEAADISTAGGLEPEGLARVLESPELFGESPAVTR